MRLGAHAVVCECLYTTRSSYRASCNPDDVVHTGAALAICRPRCRAGHWLAHSIEAVISWLCTVVEDTMAGHRWTSSTVKLCRSRLHMIRVVMYLVCSVLVAFAKPCSSAQRCRFRDTNELQCEVASHNFIVRSTCEHMRSVRVLVLGALLRCVSGESRHACRGSDSYVHD